MHGIYRQLRILNSTALLQITSSWSTKGVQNFKFINNRIPEGINYRTVCDENNARVCQL